MTQLDIPELLWLDPATAPDQAFDGWTIEQIEPVRTLFKRAFDAASWFSYEAKALADNALAVFSLWTAKAASPDCPDPNIASEHRRAEIAEMRILLQMCDYFQRLAVAVAANPDPSSWPSMPLPIAPNVHSHVELTLPVFDVKAWAAARRKLLLDVCSAPVVDGRVCVSALDPRAQRVLNEWERSILNCVSDQLGPGPVWGLQLDWKQGGSRH